jgi:hypothetical protein
VGAQDESGLCAGPELYAWLDQSPEGVVTGGLNLGYQDSYNNDENLVMIKGNKKLAVAYPTHVLDVYDDFSWVGR